MLISTRRLHSFSRPLRIDKGIGMGLCAHRDVGVLKIKGNENGIGYN
jgi:hypothetical protein